MHWSRIFNTGSVTIWVFLLIIPIIVTSGCLDSNGSGELDLVIVSIAPQKEMVERIAGDGIEVVVLVPENMDPHIYSPTPSQLLKVAKADIYFKMGSGIEFEQVNMDTIQETNPSMMIVDLSQGIDVVSFEDHGVTDDHADEDMHDNDGTDPHVWLDPSNMVIMAGSVLDALIREDPDNNATYILNHASYAEEFEILTLELKEKLRPYKGREFLTYHPSWGYFADAFDLVQIAVEENGREPGPQGIASLIEQTRSLNITVVFVEPQFDTSSAQQIADEIGGSVVTVDPLSTDYMSNLASVVEKMIDGFEAMGYE